MRFNISRTPQRAPMPLVFQPGHIRVRRDPVRGPAHGISTPHAVPTLESRAYVIDAITNGVHAATWAASRLEIRSGGGKRFRSAGLLSRRRFAGEL